MYEGFNMTNYGQRTTFVMSKAQMAEFDPRDDHAALKHHVNLTLFGLGAYYAGMVHSWEYANGDVRFTYQQGV